MAKKPLGQAIASWRETTLAMDPKLKIVLNMVLIVVVLGGYLIYLVRAFPKMSQHQPDNHSES